MPNYLKFNTPLGGLLVASEKGCLKELHFEGDSCFKQPPVNWTYQDNDPLLQQTKKQITEYFKGERKLFELPYLLKGTAFQIRVWEELSGVEYGEVSSYKKIAAQIKNPKAARAVGTALSHNPLCLILPCHRVINSNGHLGGYAGGLQRKKALLSLEKTGVDMPLGAPYTY